jgi:phosphonate transport system permease protein
MRVATAGFPQQEIHLVKSRYPRVFEPLPAEKVKRYAIWFLFLGLTFFCLVRTDFLDLENFIKGIGKLGGVIQFMLPPRHNGWLGEFLYAILETLAMAFIGTLAASLAAIPLGFLGAKNVIPSGAFHFGLRRLFDGIRGVDSLIWALVFVNVVGLGPFAGILAIAVSDTGTLAKLFAEAIENVDNRPIEGVRSSGANRIQIMRLGILPQVFPVLLSNSLYYFESNTRSATILGVVGAGGIGLQLSDRIRVNNWDEASFIICLILITVFLIDTLSKEIRIRFIRNAN